MWESNEPDYDYGKKYKKVAKLFRNKYFVGSILAVTLVWPSYSIYN